ncbi:sulfotransferase family protein [Nonomuraea sp. NPDC052116]|uniref:sulfotransferase-like domain-containing protein n=1 Tax=Nonomuraea sp. NPDC052116 TaxID=3155665 RepID=UPI003438BF56
MSASPRILALWSAPRSRSTAFLRMMKERGDFEILHEPFSQVTDFGRYVVDGAEVTGERELISAIRRLAERTPVFFKDTTDFRYPHLLADSAFLREGVHTFIVREPAAAIASHFALNANLSCEEVGFERLSEIYDAVVESTGGKPSVVIDSDELAGAPGPAVKAYCAAVGIPFVEHALSWQAELLPDWRQTRRWHELTSRTTGFTRDGGTDYRDTVDNNSVLAGYLRHHLPYYRKLYDNRLAIGPGRCPD